MKKNFFFTCLCVNLNCKLEKYTGWIDIVCALRNIECWWQSICLWTRNCVIWYASDKFNFRLSPRYIGCLFLEHTELYACFPQTTNTLWIYSLLLIKRTWYARVHAPIARKICELLNRKWKSSIWVNYVELKILFFKIKKKVTCNDWK